ncbi:MAG: amino acid adenylation domain-containing protein, partial [Deltaproteobacteria bacterium]|nr:amino acid adenylation domain-containing protein [Deltaproteobacteria bacterium]
KIRPQEGSFDTELLAISLGECIRRHEALRTSFHQIDGRLVRKIVDEPAFLLAREKNPGGGSVEELLAAFIHPFDLEKAPLLRAAVVDLEDGSHLFMLDLLHIVADGASLGILLDDLNAFMNGREPVSRPVALRNLNNGVAPEDVHADVIYWQERLKDLPPLELPLDFPVCSASPVGRQEWFTIDAPLVEKTRQTCRRFGVTLNMFLNGIYVLLLHKLGGGVRFCVGMAEGGRYSAEAAGVMGMFVNTVPQDFRIAPEMSLPEFFSGVREACADAMAHNHAPYGDIVQALGRSPAATMLSYEKGDQRRPNWPGLEILPLAFPGQGAMYDFAIDIVELDGVLHCNLLSSEALRPETARAFGECFAHLVEAVGAAAADPQARVREIDPVPARQRERILSYGKGPALPFDRSRTVIDLFRETAQRCSSKTALVFQNQRISYGDLDRLSDRLARRLRAAGAGKEEKVALLDERGPAFVVGALAALKAGAAYLPLAADTPLDRLAFQLADAAPVVLLSSRQKRPPDTVFSGEWVDSAALFNLSGDEALSPLLPPADRDLAYLIYTSGTTGQPKGVMIEHHSLTNLCLWFVDHYGIIAEDRATAFAPFVFDASVWEIFPMLIRGATLHILDDATRHDLPRLHDYLRNEAITVCYFLSQVAELIEGDSLPDLRLMLSGGEALHRAAPAGNYRHCNTYGPTEFTVTATSFDLDGTWPVPIGRPTANSWCLILDAAGRLQPLGVPGDLCLSGEQLARGYLQRPELTERVFLPNPLAPEDPVFGRMYRTGDLCRWLPDGNIEFLGRLDQQVKLRGHRIELAEIEKVLQGAPGAVQVVAAIREDGAGVRQLCAYVVPSGEGGADVAAKLRAHAAAKLPPYMVPAHILLMDALPVGTSGKVDRKALPPLAALPQRIFDPPATREEKALAEVWREQLKVGQVGRQDNFFELG